MSLAYNVTILSGFIVLFALAVLGFLGGYTCPCDVVFPKTPQGFCSVYENYGEYNQIAARIVAGAIHAVGLSIVPSMLFIAAVVNTFG
jgi:hypothetical protein